MNLFGIVFPKQCPKNVCVHFLMETPIQNGGIGHSVQIDESLVATRIQV